jgi:isopentenyl-diphosphate delta-isomerase type 1
MTDLHTAPPQRRAEPDDPGDDVVLLDGLGRPVGRRPRATVHDRRTPLHLAFSCHVVDPAGRVLLTRRALAKRTWPGTWTNACCGHPRPGEALGHAVRRRLLDELGVAPGRLGLAVPDFAYRAAVPGGPVEHELCPVVIAEVDEPPRPAPAEIDDLTWVAWDDVCRRVDADPGSLSPWAVAQVNELRRLARSPLAWLDAHVGPGSDGAGEVGLDRVPGPGARRYPGGRDGAADARGVSGPDPTAAVRPAVDAVLADFLAAREREMGAADPAVLEVVGPVRRLVAAGGKRLRPAFVYWGHRATGAPHVDATAFVGAAIEMLHTFALLHDDVIDRSARRRGQPAAAVALRALHRDRGLSGDGAWFGTSAALLAGDLCFVWADQLLDAAPLPPAALEVGRRVFAALRSEVIGGQYLDLRLAHDPGAGEDAARRVALLKSARYTVTRPLLLGAALAARPGPSDALTRYGDAVGLAFQMRDDVLGLFGDPAATGKDPGDDLREGKRTLLVLRALRLTDGRDRRVLREALGDADLDAAGARRCRDIVTASGALASIEALIEAERARAVHALTDVPEPARTALAALAATAAQRDR